MRQRVRARRAVQRTCFVAAFSLKGGPSAGQVTWRAGSGRIDQWDLLWDLGPRASEQRGLGALLLAINSNLKGLAAQR